MFSDPIADYLTRIRNAQMAGHKVVDIPTDSLVLGGGAPQYDMPSTEPEYLSKINLFKMIIIL